MILIRIDAGEYYYKGGWWFLDTTMSKQNGRPVRSGTERPRERDRKNEFLFVCLVLVFFRIRANKPLRERSIQSYYNILSKMSSFQQEYQKNEIHKETGKCEQFRGGKIRQ